MLIVDRIERGVAVCEREDRTMLPLPLEQLPQGVKEGDCLRETADGYIIDEQQTLQRRALNLDLTRKLFRQK